MKTYKIELAIDTDEQEQLKLFLESLGHSVTIGDSTGSFVNGFRSDHEDCPLNFSQLWNDYCNS